MNHLPKAPENNIRFILNFFENSWRTTGINDIGGKFATGVDTGGK